MHAGKYIHTIVFKGKQRQMKAGAMEKVGGRVSVSLILQCVTAAIRRFQILITPPQKKERKIPKILWRFIPAQLLRKLVFDN